MPTMKFLKCVPVVKDIMGRVINRKRPIIFDIRYYDGRGLLCETDEFRCEQSNSILFDKLNIINDGLLIYCQVYCLNYFSYKDPGSKISYLDPCEAESEEFLGEMFFKVVGQDPMLSKERFLSTLCDQMQLKLHELQNGSDQWKFVSVPMTIESYEAECARKDLCDTISEDENNPGKGLID